IGERANAEDFSAQVVGIGRGLLCVEGIVSGPFIDGGVAIGITAGISVIAGGDEKVAIGAELDRAGVMTAFASLFAEFEHFDFAGEIELILFHREAAQALADKISG